MFNLSLSNSRTIFKSVLSRSTDHMLHMIETTVFLKETPILQEGIGSILLIPTEPLVCEATFVLEEFSNLQLSERGLQFLPAVGWKPRSLLEAAHNSLLCTIPQNSHLLPHSDDEKDFSKMDTTVL